jgi:Protein of unknown function (DUF3800)
VSFGDYVVYVDESGDHGLQQINPQFPVFVLAFCIFRVEDYVSQVVPAVERLKFDFFGHDMIVLHEREIRKALPPFQRLLEPTIRAEFVDRLSSVVQTSAFTVVAVAIRKEEFKSRRGAADNPYNVALEYGLERVFFRLQDRLQVGRETSVIFESRGRTEDDQLELEYRRILDTTRVKGMSQTLQFRIASKQVNSSGLQLADMVARPIALKVIRPDQKNRAWEIIEPKLARSSRGNILGYGLKVYP